MGIQVGNFHGVVAADDPPSTSSYADADMISEAAMDARLTAIDGTYYSATRLRQMNVNDKMYAIRTNDAPDSIE